MGDHHPLGNAASAGGKDQASEVVGSKSGDALSSVIGGLGAASQHIAPE